MGGTKHSRRSGPAPLAALPSSPPAVIRRPGARGFAIVRRENSRVVPNQQVKERLVHAPKSKFPKFQELRTTEVEIRAGKALVINYAGRSTEIKREAMRIPRDNGCMRILEV